MKINKEFRKKEKLEKQEERELRKSLQEKYNIKIKRCKICCTLYFYLLIEKETNKINPKKIFFNIKDVEMYLKVNNKKNDKKK